MLSFQYPSLADFPFLFAWEEVAPTLTSSLFYGTSRILVSLFATLTSSLTYVKIGIFSLTWINLFQVTL